MNGTAILDPITLQEMERSSGFRENNFLSQEQLAENFLNFPFVRKYVVIDGELYIVSDEIPPEINSTE